MTTEPTPPSSDEQSVQKNFAGLLKEKSTQTLANAQQVALQASQRMPLYAVAPGFELLHRTAATFLLVILILGLYEVEHPGASMRTIAQDVRMAAAVQMAGVGTAAQEAWVGFGFARPDASVSVQIVPSTADENYIEDDLANEPAEEVLQ